MAVSSDEDVDMAMSQDVDHETLKKAVAEHEKSSSKGGKQRGKGKGKFNMIFNKEKKINAPPAPKSTEKSKDQKKPDQKDFNAGVILQSPVGMAPVFTTMLPNFGFLASTINEAKASCQKPETVNLHPFLGACFDLTSFAVRRAFCLKDEGITPWRGFGVSPTYEGGCYAECETLKGTVYCTNVNAALILRSIGTFTDKYGDRYHSFEAPFVNAPGEQQPAVIFDQQNYVNSSRDSGQLVFNGITSGGDHVLGYSLE